MNDPVKAIVARLNEGMRAFFCPTMEVGARIQHPDGYLVEVVSGRYLDPTYGTVSNWWTWRRVLEDGHLGVEESGYGW